MNHKTKLKELAAKSASTVKELGILPTKNRPDFDERGNFNGMRESVDAKKTVAGAVGTTAVAGGALAANGAIQSGFGGQGVESWKQAGRFAGNEAKVFVKKKGLGLAGVLEGFAKKIRPVAATVLSRKTPKARLKELAAKCKDLKVAARFSEIGRMG